MTRGFSKTSTPIVDAIQRVFTEHKPPLTVRQIYYQLASAGLVPLSMPGYKQAQRLLLRVREQGLVPWEHFADRVRERIRPAQWDDAGAFMDVVSGAYRKNLWQSQAEHVEIWLEKDATSQFVAEVLKPYGVSLYATRGFSSVTFVHEAAAALSRIDKPKYVYYLGDFDPAGLAIEEAIRSRLLGFGVALAGFERIAIHLEDIKAFNLRPLVAKKQDSRYVKYAAKHGTASIELDALPPTELRRRIVAAVERHLDREEWDRLRRVERIERETIRGITARIEALT